MLAPPGAAALPVVVEGWLAALRSERVRVARVIELMAVALRSRPRVAVLDGRRAEPGGARGSATAAEGGSLDDVRAACTRLKADSYTGIVPTLVLLSSAEDAPAALDSGADEVIYPGIDNEIGEARLRALLRRSNRDTGVHPSTRLPGAVEIEAEIDRRLVRDELFGVCYADLDHFKEFNDRYGYNNGDRIIRLLARILHDVVKGTCGEQGFVGHIGGDDFLFVVPFEHVDGTCAEIISVFDVLAPLQYSEPDRRAGYFFGKDRRGRLHRVPLMTLSIGVVSNSRRSFAAAAEVAELATEMKSYAKSLPGSIFTVDRRSEADEAPAADAVPRLALVDDGSDREGEGDGGGGGGVGAAGAPGDARSAAGQVREYPRLVGMGGDAGAFAPKLNGTHAEDHSARNGRESARATVRGLRAVAQLGED